MEKLESFKFEERKYSLEEIKKMYDDKILPNRNCVNSFGNDMYSHFKNLVTIGVSISQAILEAVNLRSRPIESFYEFIICSCQLYLEEIADYKELNEEFLEFIDPILIGELKPQNEVSIASTFSVNCGKYLTKNRLSWLKHLDFVQLSRILDAWLDLDVIDYNCVKSAVRKSNNIDFNIVLELRSILREKYIEICDDIKYNSDLCEYDSVLKVLYGLDNLSILKCADKSEIKANAYCTLQGINNVGLNLKGAVVLEADYDETPLYKRMIIKLDTREGKNVTLDLKNFESIER